MATMIVRTYGKIRPALVLQDRHGELTSIVCCMITGHENVGPHRVPIGKSDENRGNAIIAVDELCSIPLREIRDRVGRLTPMQLAQDDVRLCTQMDLHC